ncbi:hypothetical protein AC579_6109 [Pseudocercospora musae]|uniref:Uncharacterized protein n=1 Tax=Pseudocercospora musae TaxID=113226 RepID=A0A139I202_9PEZI|nr:hypothetical protein AC579_6109 [Pseudocercospora musae]
MYSTSRSDRSQERTAAALVPDYDCSCGLRSSRKLEHVYAHAHKWLKVLIADLNMRLPALDTVDIPRFAPKGK